MPTLIINYTYGKDANKKLVADFGMMKIYSQGDMRS